MSDLRRGIVYPAPLAQPNCPYCGRPAKIPSDHVVGRPEPGICGTRWYQDYGPQGFRPPDQTEACKEICRLDAELDALHKAQASKGP